jgi:hypothetical protein
MYLPKYRYGYKISQDKVRCLSLMLKLLEKLGNCVNLKVRSMHPSNTSGDLKLSRVLKLVTRRCSKKITPSLEQTKERKTKTSSYTQKFRKRYGSEVKSLPDIAKATGIPLKTVQKIYNRGLAAWRTGHRPGASPQAWGYARVHSFATKGKTYYTADKDLR